jgi:DNA-binding transcriptional MerR regulator
VTIAAPEILTIHEAAAFFSVSHHTIAGWNKRKLLVAANNPSPGRGHVILLRRADIEQILATKRAEEQARIARRQEREDAAAERLRAAAEKHQAQAQQKAEAARRKQARADEKARKVQTAQDLKLKPGAEAEAAIRRVVVRAFEEGTLGPESPWYASGPPSEYFTEAAA